MHISIPALDHMRQASGVPTFVTAFLFSMTLSSCAVAPSTGRSFQQIDVPVDRSAVIYVYAPRTGMPVLGQMSADIFVDDKRATRVDEGLFARLEVLPGSHNVHASTDTAMACGGQLFPGRRYPPVAILAASGQVYALRYSAHPVRRATGCDRYLKLIDIDVARGEMVGLKEAAK
jgi:hypothetical protein